MPALGDDDRLVAVIDAGEVVAVTTDLDAGEVAALAGGTTMAPRRIDGEPHRVVRADDGTVEVVVAASTGRHRRDRRRPGPHAGRWIVPAATVLLAAAVWILIGRTLRPVERIRAEVAAIGFDELDRRVPQPAG